ncbi:VAN3-binding protein-like [Dioscorea cayenensis subsp. rotundata]|uniref:VAN3-binding protein-like n=1 Tax=Dioscorea cayennensis subsp. rotundata TaxID=55577 RepID=A0AB40ARD9_DIOCR|nr:VAN3-binding protein-like [Dioscorea cayenensis subsp. rotundata]
MEKPENQLKVEDEALSSIPQVKFDDMKSWLWLQQAIHPELDYDIGLRKKWFSLRITQHWKDMSIKKWIKEIKQKRKEKDRLKRAEVHAAISVARLSASLAAIAAENTVSNTINNSKENAVAAAAALIAKHCATVAETIGAPHDHLASEINNAIIATDANNLLTLTAAAATSLKGAATLKGIRPHDFDFGRCRSSLAKGEELIVHAMDGKWKIRLVSVVLNRDAKVILRMRKTSILMSLSNAHECVVYDMKTEMVDEEVINKDENSFYCVDMSTSDGKIELKIKDYVQFKKWSMTINQMLMLSTTFSAYELQFYRS